MVMDDLLVKNKNVGQILSNGDSGINILLLFDFSLIKCLFTSTCLIQPYRTRLWISWM